MKKISHNIEENIFISIILTFIGGFLDAYTFILYDGVFANTQTGNLIFLSMSLVEKDFNKIILNLLPILSFCLAIFINQFLLNKFEKNKLWIKIVLVINILTTFIISLGILKNYKIIIICLISFMCALLIGTFKKSKGDIFAPTMCTGNLRSLMEFFSKWIIYKQKDNKKIVLKYLIIIFSFIIGVAFGVIMINYFYVNSIFICSMLFLVVYLIIHYNGKKYNI